MSLKINIPIHEVDGVVWCEVHGVVHADVRTAGLGALFDLDPCDQKSWRPVYTVDDGAVLA